MASGPWSLADAERWLLCRAPPRAVERVPLAAALGRVLAAPMRAQGSLPRADQSLIHGHAVQAELTQGASAYNPVALPAARAVPIAAGEPLPLWADAVVQDLMLRATPDGIELTEPATPGSGVQRAGGELAAGETALAAGRVLRPQDLGLLAALGLDVLPVIRRPVVEIIAAADTSLLAALVTRDGGVPQTAAVMPGDGAGLVAALQAPGADLVLLSGGSGKGAGDMAAAALGRASRLVQHGLLLLGAETAGLGKIGAVPVLLLPGLPRACYTAYELLAGPAVRAMGGLRAEWPHGRADLPLRRKLVSELGLADLYPVRIAGGMVEPLLAGGLAAVSQADGFVLVAAESEGMAAGSLVSVALYEPSLPA